MAAVTTPGDVIAGSGGAGRRASTGRRRRRQTVFRTIVLLSFAAFFLLPLGAMVAFSFRGTVPGTHSLNAWTQIVDDPDAAERDRDHARARGDHAAVVMLVLLVPTMIWVHLRVPRLSRVIEFLCLLPLTVPAIVLVVGLAPIYRQIRIYVSLSALMLFGIYVVLALPYAYRALADGPGVDRRPHPVRGGTEPRARAGSR